MATTPRPLVWEDYKLIATTADKSSMTEQYADGNAKCFYLKNQLLQSRVLSITQGHWKDAVVGAETQESSDPCRDFASVQPVTGHEYQLGVFPTVSGDAMIMTKLIDGVVDVTSTVT